MDKVIRSIRRPWITQEILNLIDEMRKYINADNNRRLGIQTSKERDREDEQNAKPGLSEEKCKAVKVCMSIAMMDAADRKIKEAFVERKSTCMNIKNSDGKLVLSKEGKAGRWKEYIEGLHTTKKFEDIMEMEDQVEDDKVGI